MSTEDRGPWRVREDTDYYAKFDWVVYRGGLYDEPSTGYGYDTTAGFHVEAQAIAYAMFLNGERSLLVDRPTPEEE